MPPPRLPRKGRLSSGLCVCSGVARTSPLESAIDRCFAFASCKSSPAAPLDGQSTVETREHLSIKPARAGREGRVCTPSSVSCLAAWVRTA